MQHLLISIVLTFTLIFAPLSQAQPEPLSVVTTTSLIADVAQNVGGELVTVTSLIPRDADSHAFQPAPQDAVLISEAQVILVNGAGLEANVLPLIESSATVPAVVVSYGAEVLASDEAHDHETHDDHDHSHDHDVDIHNIPDLSTWQGEGISAYTFLTDDAAHDIYHVVADTLGITEDEAQQALADIYATGYQRMGITQNAITFDDALVCEYTLHEVVNDAAVFFQTSSEGCADYAFFGLSIPHGEGKSNHYHIRYGASVEDAMTASAYWDPVIYHGSLTVEEYLAVVDGGTGLVSKTAGVLGIEVEADADGHDHEEAHDHDHAESIDVYSLTDFSVWQGAWVSASQHLQHDTGHAAIHTLAGNIHADEAAVEAVFHELLDTQFSTLDITADSITYDGTLTCEYGPVNIVETDFEGSAFQWIVAETSSEGCTDYQYALFTIPHGEGAGAHYHLRYGSGELDTLINSEALALWYPSIYPAEVSVEDFAVSIAESGEWDAFIAGVLGLDVEAAEAETHDHDHDHTDASTNRLGIEAICEADTSHDHDETDHGHSHGPCDPHFWGDPANVMVWAQNIADAFAAADPANTATYQANADAYIAQLAALDAEVEAILSAVPQQNRKLITNHHFLDYFAHRYGFEVIGAVLPAVSSVAEPAPQDVAELIELIQAEGVTAIFAEVSDPASLSNVIAQDAGGLQVVTLYSESLSQPDGPAATYLDYMRTNAQLIASALGE